jgi:hypothetical protein
LRFWPTIVIINIENRGFPPPVPHREPIAARTSRADALALGAVRTLLVQERTRAGRPLPSTDCEWRFLLALYEAELDGRALTPAEAAEAAAVPPDCAGAIAEHLEAQDFLVPWEAGALRLTELACEHLALWVYALAPFAGFNPYRATGGAPPRAPPPEPPG